MGTPYSPGQHAFEPEPEPEIVRLVTELATENRQLMQHLSGLEDAILRPDPLEMDLRNAVADFMNLWDSRFCCREYQRQTCRYGTDKCSRIHDLVDRQTIENEARVKLRCPSRSHFFEDMEVRTRNMACCQTVRDILYHLQKLGRTFR
jgi:hypothetical protein